MQFTGPKAAESLTGLVTNDVLALRGGDGVYACALTTKGRIIADVRILRIAGDDDTTQTLLVDANPAAGVGFATMIRKYVNPRLARYADVTSSTSCLTLVGESALELLRGTGAANEAIDDVSSGPAFTHRLLDMSGVAARLVRVPDLGTDDTFDLHCDRDAAAALLAVLTAHGARADDAAEWHRLRVIGARPEWGIDMDEGTLAQEANMDALNAISYQKGCYTGQETVARVHFRGHVNRTLRRVMYEDGAIPAVSTPLLMTDGAAVGDARSGAVADDGSAVGIAMLRREVGDGAELTWMAGDDRMSRARVLGVADGA